MVAPSLAYNGNTGFNPQTHGLLLKSEDRVNIPVLSFLIQTGNKNILVDTGIKRELESEEPLSFDKQLKAIKAPLTFASRQATARNLRARLPRTDHQRRWASR